MSSLRTRQATRAGRVRRRVRQSLTCSCVYYIQRHHEHVSGCILSRKGLSCICIWRVGEPGHYVVRHWDRYLHGYGDPTLSQYNVCRPNALGSCYMPSQDISMQLVFGLECCHARTPNYQCVTSQLAGSRRYGIGVGGVGCGGGKR